MTEPGGGSRHVAPESGVFAPGGPAIVGHRGARRQEPENTPASFAEAARQGAGWVELDVRLSADAVPVVVHDHETPGGQRVCGATAAELAAQGILRLDEVLRGLPTGLGADVEVKHRRGEPGWDPDASIAAACADVLTPLLGMRPLLVTSFDAPVLDVLRRHVTLPTGLLTGMLIPLATCAARARELGCEVVAPHFTAPGLSPEGVAATHDRGQQVLVWTVNSSWRVRRLAAALVDAICTDDITGTVRALRMSSGTPGGPADDHGDHGDHGDDAAVGRSGPERARDEPIG